MGKNRKGRRRGDDSSSEEDNDDQQADLSTSPNKKGDLDFKQRRELQRKEAAEKRRSKMKCHLCGKAGHVRRDCPGIADDGRGESKYKSAKGDAGAKYKKGSKKNRGQKSAVGEEQEESASTLVFVELPTGFESIASKAPASISTEVITTEVDIVESTSIDVDETEITDTEVVVQQEIDDQFLFYDAGTDGAAAIQHLQTRVGDTKVEAIEAYQTASKEAAASSNYGGCIAQHYMKTNQASWDVDALPSPWRAATARRIDADVGTEEDQGEEQSPKQQPWFVVGLNAGWNCSEDDQEALDVLAKVALTKNSNIVGFCATLDYTKIADRQLQLTRAWCTCKAAMQANLPIQLRLLPACKEASDKDNVDSPYSILMTDVEGLLDKIVETTNNDTLPQVHLSRWSGHADTMAHLLQRFPDNLWIGLDGTVTFQKATRAHECAFDVPLNKLLLESGTTIPSQVVAIMGRQAFCHSGWTIPFVAASIAEYKKDGSSTAGVVARIASQNTAQVYGLVVDDVDVAEGPSS